MEIRLWNVTGSGVDCTVELSPVQEKAIMTILGLDFSEFSRENPCYGQYTDEVVSVLTSNLEKTSFETRNGKQVIKLIK